MKINRSDFIFFIETLLQTETGEKLNNPGYLTFRKLGRQNGHLPLLQKDQGARVKIFYYSYVRLELVWTSYMKDVLAKECSKDLQIWLEATVR